MSWTEVRIPATSANLGPGFDALGMALSVAPPVDLTATKLWSDAVSLPIAPALLASERAFADLYVLLAKMLRGQLQERPRHADGVVLRLGILEDGAVIAQQCRQVFFGRRLAA